MADLHRMEHLTSRHQCIVRRLSELVRLSWMQQTPRCPLTEQSTVRGHSKALANSVVTWSRLVHSILSMQFLEVITLQCYSRTAKNRFCRCRLWFHSLETAQKRRTSNCLCLVLGFKEQRVRWRLLTSKVKPSLVGWNLSTWMTWMPMSQSNVAK